MSKVSGSLAEHMDYAERRRFGSPSPQRRLVDQRTLSRQQADLEASARDLVLAEDI